MSATRRDLLCPASRSGTLRDYSGKCGWTGCLIRKIGEVRTKLRNDILSDAPETVDELCWTIRLISSMSS